MANYSAAFGYQVYIVPVAATSVDSAYTGVTQAISATSPVSKTISNVARTANLVTITTSTNHGFTAGSSVVVTAGTNTSINGTYTIVAAPTTATFTYVKTGADITSGADTGTAVIRNNSAGGFIGIASTVLATDTISYNSGVITAEGVTFAMNGSDKPAELVGLTNAALKTDTKTEDIITYDRTTGGYVTSVATNKSWSVELAGVADFKNAAYQILRLVEQNTVADALRVKFVRVGPTGSTEAIYGYGTLTGYTESVDAGKIVSWKASLMGYGKYLIDIDVNA
jgi:hypothetical protein